MWEQDGESVIEEAVLTVHGDRVYIFRANARPDDAVAAREALDAILALVEWQ
jgi:hypothetical protein